MLIDPGVIVREGYEFMEFYAFEFLIRKEPVNKNRILRIVVRFIIADRE